MQWEKQVVKQKIPCFNGKKSNVKQHKSELLTYLAKYWECSQNEVKEYLDFLEDDEILRILERMGIQQKELNKLL